MFCKVLFFSYTINRILFWLHKILKLVLQELKYTYLTLIWKARGWFNDGLYILQDINCIEIADMGSLLKKDQVQRCLLFILMSISCISYPTGKF